MKLDPDQQALLKLFYEYVRGQPCLRCGTISQIEVAHILSIPSSKIPGQLMPRSHKTLAAFGAISLCSNCHRLGNDSLHNFGNETVWLEQEILGGYARAVSHVLKSILVCWLGGRI